MKYNLYSPISLSLILTVKAFIMIAFILYGNIGLGPDEAQYWSWSQQLDWGYYSKPPGIAWQIWIGTQIFGNTELGVRFLSIIFSFLLSITTYFISEKSNLSPRISFWSGIIMAFSPLGMISSLFAITDIGMVLSWSLATFLMTKAITTKQTPNYILLGLILLFGALFKWPVYLFWIILLPFIYFYPYLKSYRFFFGNSYFNIGFIAKYCLECFP